jgi:hypothetical protein
MSELKRIFDDQMAEERLRQEAEDERRRQLVAAGEANVAAFLELMSEHGMAPLRLPRRVLVCASTSRLVREIAAEAVVRKERASDGWSARLCRDDPVYGVSHYITADGQVIASGFPNDDKAEYVSPAEMADTEALAAHARAIIRHGDAHYGAVSQQRPALPPRR